ncbi:hypothetical protein ACFC5Z_13815 [Streptomyces sp. NPDC056004]|uniref:hypothetical protein n=1 Tax=Streptomyces sp. NPDC056004 TaxID=3345677 RepID=UPI0035D8D036
MNHPVLPAPKPLVLVVDEAAEVLRTHPEAAEVLGVSGHVADVAPWNPEVLDKALRASWAVDTCSPDARARVGWQPGSTA